MSFQMLWFGDVSLEGKFWELLGASKATPRNLPLGAKDLIGLISND